MSFQGVLAFAAFVHEGKVAFPSSWAGVIIVSNTAQH